MEEVKAIPNYSDVKKQLQRVFPEVEKVELLTVMNRDIIIYDFKALPSSIAVGKEFVVILADFEGKRVCFNCGEIVLKQLQDIKDNLPVKARIIREKGKRYYTLI